MDIYTAEYADKPEVSKIPAEAESGATRPSSLKNKGSVTLNGLFKKNVLINDNNSANSGQKHQQANKRQSLFNA